MRVGDTKMSAWLQQDVGGEPLAAFAAAYHFVGGPVAYLPVPHAEHFIDSVACLLAYAHSRSDGSRPASA